MSIEALSKRISLCSKPLSQMSAMISSKIRLKVQSVKAVKDVEKRESYQIDFVEIRQRPPMVMMTPPEVPEEIGQMVVQISKGVQRVLPGGDAKEYEVRKLTMILTAEELEAFKLKPYPNQVYELTITDGALYFKEI
jgi:hypothetical protein